MPQTTYDRALNMLAFRARSTAELRRQLIRKGEPAAEVDAVYFPQIEVVGDIANAVWQLGERLKPQPHWDFAFFDRVRAALLANLDERTHDDRFPLRLLPPYQGADDQAPRRFRAGLERAAPMWLPEARE